MMPWVMRNRRRQVWRPQLYARLRRQMGRCGTILAIFTRSYQLKGLTLEGIVLPGIRQRLRNWAPEEIPSLLPFNCRSTAVQQPTKIILKHQLDGPKNTPELEKPWAEWLSRHVF
jgi:hypothetical protein